MTRCSDCDGLFPLADLLFWRGAALAPKRQGGIIRHEPDRYRCTECSDKWRHR